MNVFLGQRPINICRTGYPLCFLGSETHNICRTGYPCIPWGAAHRNMVDKTIIDISVLCTFLTSGWFALLQIFRCSAPINNECFWGSETRNICRTEYACRLWGAAHRNMVDKMIIDISVLCTFIFGHGYIFYKYLAALPLKKRISLSVGDT